MLKKTAAMLAIASLVLTACKKENAALRIDDETAKQAEVAHAQSGALPVAKFDNPEHDFGTITAGEKVEHTFKVTNEGTADLVISEAKPSCGCTVPDFTKEPIKPGATGDIKVIFDSTGKSGNQEKTVTVTVNTEKASEVLKFKANVAAPAGGIGVTPATH
ncbi:hypothetical protein AMR72_04290 [Flavobacterium psychrophilum]|nr:hypothetical protein AMR72_04290 [Flavobacterium psychrophilum]AOE51802.1 hypothetical protein ALW18_04285 [Flavobacterium psychrophilum]